VGPLGDMQFRGNAHQFVPHADRRSCVAYPAQSRARWREFCLPKTRRLTHSERPVADFSLIELESGQRPPGESFLQPISRHPNVTRFVSSDAVRRVQ
jgi:hypothetical protein